jgi:Raf kinase inhibitor-like YbhB/YbcL family protein
MRCGPFPIVLALVLVGTACSSTDLVGSGGDGGPSGKAAQDAAASPKGPSSQKDASSSAPVPSDSGQRTDAAVASLTVTSPAFTAGAFIPKVHSCNGAGESIPLAWSGAPEGTQSYAVVMRDLSLPGPNNYHWVIWDILAATTSLTQGIAKQAQPGTPAGAKQTAWSFGSAVGYGHVCPPAGSTHDYELSVYAFSTPTLPSAEYPASPNEVDAIIQANKTAAGSIVGKYTGE